MKTVKAYAPLAFFLVVGGAWVVWATGTWWALVSLYAGSAVGFGLAWWIDRRWNR